MADDAAASIRAGRGVLAALSPYDLGQAVAVAGDRVLAVEGAKTPETRQRRLDKVVAELTEGTA